MCYFDINTYKDTCGVFEIMEVFEQLYKVVSPSKNINQADSNRSGRISNKAEREFASPSNP